MKNTQLIQVLKTLSSLEQKRLRHFLASPYFNQNPRLLPLLEEIIQWGPSFDSPQLTKAELFTHVFPEQDFQDQLIRNELSYLFRMVKQFLVQESWKGQNQLVQTSLLQIAAERRLSRLFDTERNRLLRQLEGEKSRGVTYFQARLNIAEAQNQSFGQAHIRREDNALNEKHHFLDLAYLTEKLKESCESLNRAQILNSRAHLPLTDLLVNWLETSGSRYLSEPQVNLYLRVYRLLKEPGVAQHFQQLRQELSQLPSTLPQADARALFLHAQNHCTRQINAGKSQFLAEIFTLYRLSLDQEVAFVEGKLPHTTYKNMATVGLRMQEFSWVEHFLESYRDRVPSRDQANVYAFCRASLLLETGQAGQALRLLNQVHFTDLPYEISGRELLLKCLWELDEWEALGYQREAFAIFLRRTRHLQKPKQMAHLAFLQALLQLCRFRETRLSMKDWQQLPALWREVPQLTHRDWLLAVWEKENQALSL